MEFFFIFNIKLIKISNEIHLIKILSGKTANCIIYNSNCFDFFLNHDITIQIDKSWHNKLIAVVAIPFITTQKIGYSDIEKKNINYNSRYDSVEKNFIHKLNNL